MNTSIIRNLRLFYCITTLVVCSCSDLCWSFGVAGLGWYPCGRLKHSFSLPHGYHPNPATPKLQHTSEQEHATIEKSQAPDDGCINIRNILSIEGVK